MEELKLVKNLLTSVVERLETEAGRIDSAASAHTVRVAANDITMALVSLEGIETEEELQAPPPHYEIVVLETEVETLTRALSLATARHRRTLARLAPGSEVER